MSICRSLLAPSLPHVYPDNGRDHAAASFAQESPTLSTTHQSATLSTVQQSAALSTAQQSPSQALAQQSSLPTRRTVQSAIVAAAHQACARVESQASQNVQRSIEISGGCVVGHGGDRSNGRRATQCECQHVQASDRDKHASG
eukprot:6208681-Pleurochrysis_carterae.AAC.5